MHVRSRYEGGKVINSSQSGILVAPLHGGRVAAKPRQRVGTYLVKQNDTFSSKDCKRKRRKLNDTRVSIQFIGERGES